MLEMSMEDEIKDINLIKVENMLYIYDQQDIDRFYNKITFDNDEIIDCWNINCCKDKDGYPRVGIKGKMYPAARFMYIIHNPGVSIENKLICHKCDNTGCVNINHLFLGTITDNNRDRNNKGREARGSKHADAILNEQDVITIFNKILNNEYTSTAQIALEYKICPETLHGLLRGRTWKHITKDFDLFKIRNLIFKKNKFSNDEIISIRNDPRTCEIISKEYNVKLEIINRIKQKIVFHHVH